MKYKDFEIQMPDPTEARNARQEYLDGITKFYWKLFEQAEKPQQFQYDYKEVAKDYDKWQKEYRNNWGKPLSDRVDGQIPEVQVTDLYSDDMGDVKRLKVKIIENIWGEGLLFLPKTYKKDGKSPLILSLHGGSGTPEMCSDTWGNSSNYNAMTRRVLEMGAVVYAPFLLVGSSPMMAQQINYCREAFEQAFKNFGYSMHAIEICHLMNAIDYLSKMDGVDEEKIGIFGMSWGSMYSMWTAAADKRIKVIYASCGQTNGSLASFIAPRKLVAEDGMYDSEFIKTAFDKALITIEEVYKYHNAEDKYLVNVHGGDHIVDPKDDALHWAFDEFFK